MNTTNKPTTVIVSRNELLRAINQVAPARITGNTTDFVYKCYIFDVQPDSLHVMASDYFNLTVRKHVEATIETDCQERQLFAIYGTLQHVLRLLGDEPLCFTFGHSQVEVKHSNGLFFMPIEYNDGFSAIIPKKEDAELSVKIEVPDFRHFLKDAAFCMNDEELRPVMSGVYFDFKDNHLVLVSSDGYKLAKVDAWSVAVDFTTSFTLKRKAVVVLQRILPKVGWVELSIWKDYIRMDVTDGQTGTLTIVSKPVEGRYPNYENVLPKDSALQITVNRKQLLAAVRRADLFANYSSKMLSFYLTEGGNQMEIKSDDYDFAMGATERVPASYGKLPLNKWSPAFRIGFKSTPLEEILRHIKDDTVILGIKDDARAITKDHKSRDPRRVISWLFQKYVVLLPSQLICNSPDLHFPRVVGGIFLIPYKGTKYISYYKSISYKVS